MKSVTLLFFVLINSSAFAIKDKTFQLEFVQALFRHGDRIPAKDEVYNTDPYDPKYYDPAGYGQLTKVGMQRVYQIGKILRKRYNNFLGELKFDKVYAYSTDFDRTKASLQLVLAGLFPPSTRSAWNELIRWTPIPTHYKPADSDFLIAPFVTSCEGLMNGQKQIERLPETQEILTKHKGFLDYVRNKTKIGDAHIYSMVLIYNNLHAIKSMGLPLPSWCSEQNFKMLSNIMESFLKFLTITPELRKHFGGSIVKQFLENMKNHQKGDKMKISLYSAHDGNVAAFTGAHNFTGIPSIPDYGSTVIVEKLRGSDNNSYVRMLLWTGVSEKLVKLKLKNCDYECPLVVYEKIVAPILPDPNFVRCLSKEGQCRTRKRTKTINPLFRISFAIAGGDLFTFKYGKEIYLH